MIKPGFIWTFEGADGVVQRVHNLMPDQALDHWLSVLLKSGTQNANWYIGVYGNDYSPIPGDTAAAMPGTAGEVTTYAGSTRPLFVPGDIVAGEVSNSASLAELTFTADATIRGAYLISSSGKGATTGVLLSAVKLSSPKVVASGEILRIGAGVGLLSV